MRAIDPRVNHQPPRAGVDFPPKRRNAVSSQVRSSNRRAKPLTTSRSDERRLVRRESRSEAARAAWEVVRRQPNRRADRLRRGRGSETRPMRHPSAPSSRGACRSKRGRPAPGDSGGGKCAPVAFRCDNRPGASTRAWSRRESLRRMSLRFRPRRAPGCRAESRRSRSEWQGRPASRRSPRRLRPRRRRETSGGTATAKRRKSRRVVYEFCAG